MKKIIVTTLAIIIIAIIILLVCLHVFVYRTNTAKQICNNHIWGDPIPELTPNDVGQFFHRYHCLNENCTANYDESHNFQNGLCKCGLKEIE